MFHVVAAVVLSVSLWEERQLFSPTRLTGDHVCVAEHWRSYHLDSSLPVHSEPCPSGQSCVVIWILKSSDLAVAGVMLLCLKCLVLGKRFCTETSKVSLRGGFGAGSSQTSLGTVTERENDQNDLFGNAYLG